MADPVKRAELIEAARRRRATFKQGPEVIAQQVASRRAKHWLPEGYEEMDRKLKKRGFLSAERRKIVLEQAARDRREAEAKLTPFERQLARVASGAKLTTIHRRPRGEPTMTLGGVSSGLL